MERPPNKQLTHNISLHSVIGGTNLPAKGNKMAWRHFAAFDESRMTALCRKIESVFEDVNANFQAKNKGKRITILVAAGFRPRVWELLQKRTGNSRHTTSDALDVVPGNCTRKLAVEILAWLNQKHSPVVGGWFGGFAIRLPTITNGEITRTGFVHFDDRGTVARWTYS